MKKRILTIVIATLMVMQSMPSHTQVVSRIKDITRVNGIRQNQLIGYGLVIGLEGTGDSSSIAAAKSITNLLGSFGIKLDESKMKGKNIAAVCVTGKLDAFAQKGDTMDVIVSSIGDAKSLQGGLLLMTPLQAPNGVVYAVAQGPLSIGGFNTGKSGAGSQANHATIGRIPAGAIIEEEIESTFITEFDTFELILKQPDFTTATSIAEQINLYFNEFLAAARNPSTIEVYIPEDFREYEMMYISRIEQLPIVPDAMARIVINERTGTVLMGGPIKLLPVAVAHGNLNVLIQASAQEDIFSEPESSDMDITIENVARGKFIELPPGNSISDVIRVLNVIGADSRDMIAILQAMKNAGALQAELVLI